MQKLWDKYINGSLSLLSSVKEAYAIEYNFKQEWLEMTEETVEAYVQRMMSELQQEGYDLDSTPVAILEKKFIEETIEINAPIEYIQLSDALSDIKIQIEESTSNEHPEFLVERLIEIKEKIEQEIKSIK